MSEYDDLLDDTDQYIDDTGDLDNGLASNLLDAEEDTFNDETFGADVEEITADDWEQDTEQFTKFQQEIQHLQGTVHIAPAKLQDQSNNFNDLGYSTSNIKAGDPNNFDINSNDDSELDLSKVLNFSIDDDESVTDHILFEANNSSHIAAFGSGQDFFMMNNGPMQNQGWAPTNIKPNVVPPANHRANQIPLQEAQRASNDFISLEDLEKQLAGASLHENYTHNQPTNNHVSESAKSNNVKLMGTNAQIPIQVGPNHRAPYYGQPIKIFPNTQLPSNIQQRPSPQMFSPNRVNPPMSQHQLQHLQSPLQPRVGVPLQPKFIGSEMMTDEEIISIIQQQQGQLQAAMTNPYVEDYYYLNYTANKNPDRPRILPPNINFTSSQENNFNSSTPPNHQFKLLGRIASQNIRTPRQLVQLDEGQNVVTKTPDGSVANKSTGSKYGVLYAIEEGLALLLDMHDIVTSLPHTAQVYQKELKSKLAINYSKILALLRITPSPSELYEGAFIVSVCQHNKGINLLRRLLSHSLYLIINLPNLTNQIFVVFYAYLHSLKDIRGVAYKNGNKESFGSLCSTVHEFVNKYFQGEFSQFQSSPPNMVDPNTINFALHKNSFLLSQLCGILGFVTMTVVNNRKDSSEVAPLLQFKEGIELLALVFMKANELKNYSMNPQEWAMVFNQFFDVSHTNFSNMLRLLTQNNDTEDHPEIWQLLTLVSQNCDVARRSVLISELRFFFAQFNSDDEMKPGMVMFLQTLQAN